MSIFNTVSVDFFFNGSCIPSERPFEYTLLSKLHCTMSHFKSCHDGWYTLNVLVGMFRGDNIKQMSHGE